MEKELKTNSPTDLTISSNFVFEKSLPELIESHSGRIALITDTHLEKLYTSALAPLDLQVFSFPAGEVHKTRETKAQLEDDLLSHHYGRDTIIVGLGGGVVTDMVGFLASTFCRGVPHIQIPTSLLGMVDASIGGKTGVNTPHGKNLIGTFHPAKEVWVDGSFLTTLPEKEMRNGLVEMIKSAIITSPSLFHSMQKDYTRWLEGDRSLQMEWIDECITIKQRIVASDPQERNGLRRILNFGHTFGHALELLENYQIPHGYAVAVGILGACYLSVQMGLLSKQSLQQIQDVFALYQIPVKAPKTHPISSWKQALSRDKKSKGGIPRFVLINDFGLVTPFDGEYCTQVDPNLIEEAIQWMSS